MFCTNCGSKLPEGARFCSTCGVRVAEIFEVPEVSEQPAAVPEAKKPEATPEKSYEAPLKKRVTFDWSNVIDEPQKKVIADIKSPWETSGNVDEKELYSEMPQPSGKSRTMSFIDVLKAEKEELARGAAPAAEPVKEARPIEYTEVLDPGYLNEGASAEKKEEKPELRIAPLYEDVDEPVVTPFDLPAEEPAADGSYTTVNTNSYNLTGLTAGTTYYVYVRAVDGDNKSKWSTVCSFIPGVLTINNTSTKTNNYVPIYGYDMDNYKVKSQFVVPASGIALLNGTQITKLVFYGTDSRSALGNNSFDVYMAEVDDATINSLLDWTTLETVYSGNLSIIDGKMTITLPEGFDYSGGNLLIGFLQTAGNSWTNLTWTGVSATNASLSGSSSASQQNFLPQISFYYSAQTTTVKKPKNLAASETAATTATLGWTDGEEGLSAWQIA